MVLKFCGGMWQVYRTDDDMDAAATRQRRLRELLQEDVSKPSSKKVFTREVRVVFDSRRPHGLAFGSASIATEGDSTGYACVVTAIDSDPSSQAAEYNDKCRGVGDHGHVVVVGMRVRAIDGVDQRGVAFEEIARRVDELCGFDGCSLTFADVSSSRVAVSPSKIKLKTVGNLVRAAQNTSRMHGGNQQATMAGPTSPSSRCSVYNAQASPRFSKWSSVLTPPSDNAVVAAAVSQSDVLAMDLAHKSAHLEAQILILKGKLGAMEREKHALAKERDDAAKECETLRHSLELQRCEAQTVTQAATEAKEADATHAASKAAELTRKCEVLQQENDTMKEEVARITAAMETLQHSVDATMLHLRELQTEHQDVQQHSEEIHARLVATQLQKSELLEQLTTIRDRQQKEDDVCRVLLEAELNPSRRSTATMAMTTKSHDDSAPMALLKRLLETRDTLQMRNDELQIELSCHEATVHAQQERLVETEDELQAVQQMADSLRQQVRAQLLRNAEQEREKERERESERDRETEIEQRPAVVVVDRTETVTPTPTPEPQTERLLQQLEAERQSNAKIQAALQVLSDKARAKLELHEKEQLFLSQFKEQLLAGITVTKYGSKGNPHSRVLYSDSQCRWISWRAPSEGAATSPRADAKLETIDLVEVLLGAKTETFLTQTRKPEMPARCLSLVFCHPCRTLDFEVENRDRALSLRRGFRLLLEEAAEKRRHEEEI